MRHIKIYIAFILLLLFVLNAKAQDPMFSQYYASPLYLNPGLAGSVKQPRLIFNSRMQWTKLPNAFNTYAASADYLVEDWSSAFGVLAMTDKAGSANLRNTSISGIYAAKIRIAEGWVFSPGVTFGYASRSIDFDKLVFGDMIIHNGPTTDDAIGHLGNQSYFDFSSGAVIYNKTFWAGFSGYHINEPNYSLLGEDAKLPMRLSVHGGMRIPIKHSILSSSKLSSIAPSFVYKTQGEFQQFDIGTNIIFDPVMVGLWYRGVPTSKNYSEKFSQDAIIFILGLNLQFVEVGYSFDFTISDIGPQSGGSHEISLTLLLPEIQSNKVKRKDKILPCPNYNGFQWNN
ncbi:MAG: type IX secretion system membrane protein PorP/SprF [Cyclobacteriaceae bacterium]|nr:type IX secretion system membrane protein PorP/SprF [Cyclobacteriaceae bacterium]MCK5369032.1 type IX secretion system membrane protein PorP/SprF [Cyclobacteriaceae bacterium]